MKINKSLGYLIITILIAIICTSGIGNMYVQRKGDNGWIFHIFSQKMGASDKQPYVSKNIDYDYTYVEQTDSVAMLSTINLPIDAKPNLITITTCSGTSTFKPEIIYIKPKGKKDLEYRLKISYPYTLWKDMYDCEKPFLISYSLLLGSVEHTANFGYSASKWKSNREKLSTIIKLIDYNTGKL